MKLILTLLALFGAVLTSSASQSVDTAQFNALVQVLNNESMLAYYVCMGITGILALALFGVITEATMGESPWAKIIGGAFLLLMMGIAAILLGNVVKSSNLEIAKRAAGALLNPKSTMELRDRRLVITVPAEEKPNQELLGKQVRVTTTPRTIVIGGDDLERLRTSSIQLAQGMPANEMLAGLNNP